MKPARDGTDSLCDDVRFPRALTGTCPQRDASRRTSRHSAALPELVTTDDQGHKAVRYSALPMHMLQAIKDPKAENDELTGRLAQQEERLRRVEGAASR
jgi:hypothetical protein